MFTHLKGAKVLVNHFCCCDDCTSKLIEAGISMNDVSFTLTKEEYLAS